jgi:ABC-type enterochelin transport system substrate-binding protein
MIERVFATCLVAGLALGGCSSQQSSSPDQADVERMEGAAVRAEDAAKRAEVAAEKSEVIFNKTMQK